MLFRSGWANGAENPSGLYKSNLKSKITLKVNGKEIESPKIIRGYASIQRLWKKGDTVELELPMVPRRIHAHPEVHADHGKVALQSGPLVYCFEEMDNSDISSLILGADASLRLDYQSGLFGGVNLIKGRAFSRQQAGPAKEVEFTAIPFFCQDNREGGGTIEVWLPEK